MTFSKLTQRTIYTVTSLLMVAFLFFFAGCSQSPVSTVKTDTKVHLLSRVPTDSTAFKTLSLKTEKYISAAEGGRLALCDVVLDIPPGALDTDTLYSISIPDINVFYNDFGTHGLIFNIPVTVTMSFRDADLTDIDVSSIRLAYINEATGEYEDIDCDVDFENKTVTAQLFHFSAYGLISDEM